MIVDERRARRRSAETVGGPLDLVALAERSGPSASLEEGMGESVAESWECVPGRHWVGDLPRPVPAEQRALDPT